MHGKSEIAFSRALFLQLDALHNQDVCTWGVRSCGTSSIDKSSPFIPARGKDL
jgi:hypothetical protein